MPGGGHALPNKNTYLFDRYWPYQSRRLPVRAQVARGELRMIDPANFELERGGLSTGRGSAWTGRALRPHFGPEPTLNTQ